MGGPRLRPHPDRCPHARTRWCRSCRYVARRDAAELKALCRREEDGVLPSTYSLSDEDLRRYANHLHDDEGWAVEEITSVVEVSPR